MIQSTDPSIETPRSQPFDLRMLEAMLQYAEDVVFSVRECDADAIVVGKAPILWATGLELTDADDIYERGIGYILALHALLRAPEALEAVAAGLCSAIAEYMHAADMHGDMAIVAALNASIVDRLPSTW